MRSPIPQFDLPGQEDAFNLRGETGIDGDRLAADIAQRQAEQKDAKEREQKEQPQLL